MADIDLSLHTTRLPGEIVLVRHGRTEWSRTGRHTGLTDVPLDQVGELQARTIARRLVDEGFDVVLVSPLRRALDTCRLAGFSDQAVVTEELHEWDYGDYEGLTTPEIRLERPGWLLFPDGCPAGEIAPDVGRRADRVLELLRAQLAGAGGGDGSGRVLIFAHGHFLRVLAARWLGLEAGAGRSLALDPATVGRLGWEHEVPVLRTWNC